MFSDLVGSTALSTRMDPEDLREVISAYQKSVAETVGRFGGFVAKFMGDGVLVYFGIHKPTRMMPSEPCAQDWRV
jgi:class 3 adenylate cyclase